MHKLKVIRYAQTTDRIKSVVLVTFVRY